MCDVETAGFFLYDLYRCFRSMLSLWKPRFSTFRNQLEFKMTYVKYVFEVNWRKLHRIEKQKFHILSQWLSALNFSCLLPRLQLIWEENKILQQSSILMNNIKEIETSVVLCGTGVEAVVFTHWVLAGNEENKPVHKTMQGWVLSFKFF